MTIHFSNIITYNYFKSADYERKVFVDGFLLQLALFLVTFKWYKKKSGLNFHQSIDQSAHFYLLGSSIDKNINGYILPFWNEVGDITINQELLEQISSYNQIVLGISSPKQDYLAEILNEHSPEKSYYCLGAAVYTKPVILSEWMLVTLGTMFVSNPKRTLKKMGTSLIPFFKAITFDRKRLIEFSTYLNTDDQQTF